MGDICYEPLIRDMTWSYSRLKTYEDCPYRWFLKYIGFPHAKPKPMFFADYGKLVHELLAGYYSGQRAPEELQSAYLTQFQVRVSAPAPSQAGFRSYFLDGLDCLKRLSPLPRQILSVEERLAFDLDGVPFVGFADLITADGEAIWLEDHKSRKLKPRSGRFPPTKTDRELDGFLRQLYLYSACVKDRCGGFPDKLCLNCFRSGLSIVEPFQPESYRAAVDWALDTVEQIAVETKFPPQMDYFKCRFLCEMQDYCDYYALSKG